MTRASRPQAGRAGRVDRFGAAGRAAAVLLTAGLLVPLGGCAGVSAGGTAGRVGDVATARVERVDFVRRVPAEGYLRAAEATVLTVPAEAPQPARILWLAPDGGRVAAGDPVVRFDPTDMEKLLVDARADLAAADLRIGKERGRSGTDLANLDRDVEVADLELDAARRFQKEDELIYSRSEIIESALDESLATDRRRHAEESIDSRRTLAERDLDLLAVERRKAQFKIDEATRGLAALEIAAPRDGIVVLNRWRGNLPRVGDTVWPNQPLAEIPDPGALQAELYVLEADAGGLAVGKPATVTVDAHPETPLAATISRVDAVAKPWISGSPVQYFAVGLDFADAGAVVAAGGKPGQRVSAVLELESVPGALVVPRQAVFDGEGGGDGGKRVFRREGGEFRAVPVTLGPVAFGRAVIASGLTEGDVVALEDPTRPAAAGPADSAGGGTGGGGAASPAVGGLGGGAGGSGGGAR